jgi:hypothetical protein
MAAPAFKALDRLPASDSPLLFPGERGGYFDIHHFRPYQFVGGSAANAALAAALRGDAFALRVRRHHERAVGAALDRPGGPAAAVVLHLDEGHEFGPDGGWTFKWD